MKEDTQNAKLRFYRHTEVENILYKLNSGSFNFTQDDEIILRFYFSATSFYEYKI